MLDGPCFAWLGMFSINRPSSCRAEGCNASDSALGHFGGPQHRPTRIVSLDVADRLESLSSHQQRRCNIIFHRFSEGQMRKSIYLVGWIIASNLHSLLCDSTYEMFALQNIAGCLRPLQKKKEAKLPAANSAKSLELLQFLGQGIGILECLFHPAAIA